MRNYWYILVILAATAMLSGCGDDNSNSEVLGTSINAGETVVVQPGDMLIPTETGTQLKVNDSFAESNSTVTVITGSARLVNR